MNIKQMVRISLFTAMMAISIIIIPGIPIILPILPFPISITLQSLFVMIVASVLPKGEALLCMIIYLIIGLMGFPVFMNGTSGFGILAGPTGGFLLSFPISAYFISLLKGKGGYIRLLILNIIFAIGLVYVIGTIQLSIYNNILFVPTLISIFVGFLIPDLIKAFIATFVAIKLKKVII